MIKPLIILIALSNISSLMSIGYDESLATKIVARCEQSKNPEGCRKFAGAIAVHETKICTTGQKETNNCWGIKNHKFKSIDEAFYHWADTYDRYWYKHRTAEDFIYKSRYTNTQKKEWIRNVNILIKQI